MTTRSERQVGAIPWITVNINTVWKWYLLSGGGVSNMLLVLSINFYFHYNIWSCMCSTGPFKYRWLKGYIYSSCYYRHQIGSIHLSHCFHIFPWLCASDVCYIIFCHLLYIHSRKNREFVFIVLCSLWWVQIVGCVSACKSYSFVCTLHHFIIIIVQTLSEDIELIKCLSDIVCRICE